MVGMFLSPSHQSQSTNPLSLTSALASSFLCHNADTCPLTKFEGGLNLLHETDDDAVIRLESAALAK